MKSTSSKLSKLVRCTLCAALGLAIASIGLQASPASADEVLEKLREKGVARIAIGNEPPWTAIGPDGKVTGAAPEIARAVLARLGVPELEASISEYGAMIPGIQARRFDIIAAGLFIKPKRCEAILFSEPDLCDAEAFAVRKGNPLGLMTYKDFADHPTAKIGASGGGSEQQLALDAGVPESRIVIVPDGQSGIKMLLDGRIDAYANPMLSVADLIRKSGGSDIELVGPIEDAPVFCAGAGFHKDDRALRDAYDAELAALKESGEFAEIVSSFGFPAEAAFMTTRDQLCGFKN